MKTWLAGIVFLIFSVNGLAQERSEPRWYFGEFRFYNVEHWYRELDNRRATSFGGNFSALSPKWHGLRTGGTYSIANNLGWDPKDPAERVTLLPSKNVSVLSEAFVKFQDERLAIRGGAFKIDTPFTSPSDALMIPVTYKGGDLVWNANEKLNVTAGYLTEIKDRESDEFLNVGKYLLNRYASAQRPRHLTLLGARGKSETAVAQIYAYHFDDIFWLGYADAMYSRPLAQSTSAYFALQAGKEQQIGDKLLGSVDSEILGAKLGFICHGHDFSVGMNHVPRTNGFRKGTWLEPYSYFTSPIYTNSMMTGLGNKLPGTATKVTWLKKFNDQWNTRVSYSILNLRNSIGATGGVWQSEWDWDLGYKFQGRFKGLGILSRLAYLDGGQRTDRVNASRLQLSYQF